MSSQNDNHMKNTVIVYTDGYCLNNGRENARGGIGVYWGANHFENVSERLGPRNKKQSSDRAVIQAAVRAISQAIARDIEHLTIFTSSKYLFEGITKRVPVWERNKWKLSNNGKIENLQDWKQLYGWLKFINKVKWVGF